MDNTCVIISYAAGAEGRIEDICSEITALGFDVEQLPDNLKLSLDDKQRIIEAERFIACIDPAYVARWMAGENEAVNIALEQVQIPQQIGDQQGAGGSDEPPKPNQYPFWFVPVLLIPGLLPVIDISPDKTLLDLEPVFLWREQCELSKTIRRIMMRGERMSARLTIYCTAGSVYKKLWSRSGTFDGYLSDYRGHVEAYEKAYGVRYDPYSEFPD